MYTCSHSRKLGILATIYQLHCRCQTREWMRDLLCVQVSVEWREGHISSPVPQLAVTEAFPVTHIALCAFSFWLKYLLIIIEIKYFSSLIKIVLFGSIRKLWFIYSLFSFFLGIMGYNFSQMTKIKNYYLIRTHRINLMMEASMTKSSV